MSAEEEKENVSVILALEFRNYKENLYRAYFNIEDAKISNFYITRSCWKGFN